MLAIRHHEFGPPEVLRAEELPDPDPGPGQARIAVAAAGVHLLDTFLRAGGTGGPGLAPALPAIPGREVAGTVDAVGEGTDPAWLGQRVTAHLGMAGAGYATLAVVGEEALLTVPDGLSPAAAVALLGTGRTTLAVVELAEPGAGDVLLVLAAAGGVGHLLVQLGKEADAVVVGAAGGPEKVAFVAGLGADVAVDYDAPGWTDRVREALGGRDVDVVVDSVGGEKGRAAAELLGVGGTLILLGWSAGTPTELSAMEIVGRSLTVTAAVGPKLGRDPERMRAYARTALELGAGGRLVPAPGATFPLARAAEAHAALAGRRTIGKVVLLAPGHEDGSW